MSEIKLTADTGGGTTSIKAPSTTTSNADVVLKLPVADGSSGQVLKTDGSGQLSFTSNAGTTINNNANNRVITGDANSNTLNGEANLTFALSGSDPILTVQGTSAGHAQLSLKTGGTTDHCSINFGDSGDHDIGEIRYTHSSDAMQFDTNNIERMRIDSSGNLGVNTTAPVEKLGVAGNMRFVNPTGTTRRINALPSGGYNVGTSGGSAIAFHRISEGAGGSDEIAFETHWQGNRHGESARISKFGGITFNGDTAAANALDDYEEGSFNPILQNGNNGYRFQYGFYVKVGNAVHFTAFIEVSATPPSSDLAIGGLPFTSRNDVNAHLYVFPMLSNRTAFGTSGGLYARFYMDRNDTHATLYYPVNSSSSNFQTVNANLMNAANASNVWMSGTYFT